MPKIIIVDYIEGAGGEYLANFINSHRGFYNERPMRENMQGSDPPLMKYLNYTSLIDGDWDKQFATYLDWFIQQCVQKGVEQIAVPYHLYKWPDHIEIISSRLPNTRYVKIDASNVRKQVTMDFFRKVYYRTLTKKHLSEIKFMSTDPDIIIKRLPMSYIDMYLLNRGIKPSDIERQKILNRDLCSNKVPPSDDIVIDYTTWFDTFISLEIEYKKLCDNLGISTQPNLLALLMKRNTENQIELTSFIKEMECQQYTLK